MNTYAALATAAAQAAPAHTGVWPVLVITTILLAGVLTGLRRLRPSDRAPLQVGLYVVVLVVSAFGVVFPALMPARDHLDAIARTGGEGILAFIVATSAVGVAASLLFAAQVLRVLVAKFARGLLRLRNPAPQSSPLEASQDLPTPVSHP